VKTQLLLFPFLAVSLPVLPAKSADLFNPAPATIESPLDADAALKRLTTNSEGKTPVVKNLDPAWIRKLADRGEPTLYTKTNSHDFAYIGMPVGGIGAGELYLSGDGRLWDWDIFGNHVSESFPVEGGLAYIHPHTVGDPHDSSQEVLERGFVIRTKQGDKVDTRTLDKDGFSGVSFSGQYPVGTVNYTDPASPVRVKLEAFSPFIPGNVADSSYPATILNYTVRNTSPEKVECTIGGWMENAVGRNTGKHTPILLQNQAAKNQGCTVLNFEMKPPAGAAKPATIFEDFESGTYTHWKAEGDAFGSRPVKRGEISHGAVVPGVQGQYYIDTFTNGNEKATGTLTSDPFTVTQPYLTFLIAGDNSSLLQESVRLLVDDQVVLLAAGKRDDVLRPVSWNVRDYIGKKARIQITDESSQAWGHILVDNIAFADAPESQTAFKDQPDIGNMALAVLGDDAEPVAQFPEPKFSDGALDGTRKFASLPQESGAKGKLVGAIRRTVTLAPGEEKTISFIVAWYFPNPLPLGLATPTSRQYTVRFKSAADVVDHLVTNFDRLSRDTMAWRDTWYDSTLPCWFLDRTFLNSSTLASSTDYLLADGRFYGYEGRYSCPGTCTHVYGYQQTMGFLFPDLEKALMEKAEFKPGIGMNPDGGIGMRAEYEPRPPVDGQSGLILRTYLACRMSADDSFLKHNYASVKKAANYLVTKYDAAHAGILVGPQGNTMDAAWYGNNTWMSLYYQAALRATAEMADASNDGAYAKSLRAIADKGRAFIESQLFNGEYFYHQPDPAHADSPGTFNGCTLEQLMGQNWAYQVGMGDIVDPAKVRTAIDSIWKNNYTSDAGAYRKVFTAGRWYAMDGEGGLIMCTFPHGGEETLKKGNTGFSAYDNECWPGSEYEITATMMWKGEVDRALTEMKTLNERFDAAKRNPWDECECGSHYSRSMASYGVFTAACGFEYDGPKGAMAFAPRVQPENFKAAFTSAQGWGSFSQKYDGTGLDATLALRYGQLRLKTLSLIVPSQNQTAGATAQVNGKSVPVTSSRIGNRITITFSTDLHLSAGQNLKIAIK
jgi:non-lysosomal glucosylceramidase